MAGFVDRLRKSSTLNKAHIVLVIERNFGGTITAHRIANIASTFRPISALSADSDKKLRRIGFVLNAELKDRYRDTMSMMLRTNTVRMARDFISSRIAEDVTSDLVKQLRAYRFELVQRKVNGVPETARKVWSGKSASQQDDLVICAQMLAFWGGVHQSDGERCLVGCDA